MAYTWDIETAHCCGISSCNVVNIVFVEHLIFMCCLGMLCFMSLVMCCLGLTVCFMSLVMCCLGMLCFMSLVMSM